MAKYRDVLRRDQAAPPTTIDSPSLKGRNLMSKKGVTILLICAIAAGCLWGIANMIRIETQGPDVSFPFWIESADKMIDPDVELSFIGITAGSEYDTITVSIENHGTNDAHRGMMYYVEFLCDDVWYTIYMPEGVPAVDIGLLPGRRTTETYLVPHDLLSVSGVYRVYVDGLGYCDIVSSE